jgi:hypothetical protein
MDRALRGRCRCGAAKSLDRLYCLQCQLQLERLHLQLLAVQRNQELIKRLQEAINAKG